MTTIVRTIEFCLSPLGLLTFLLLAGLLLSAFRRRQGLGRRLLLFGAALFLLLLFLPVAEILIAQLERPYPPLLDPASAASGARTIVVLSEDGEDNRRLPPTSQLSRECAARVAEGIRLYRALPGSRLVLSGGVLRTGERPVARAMAEFAVAMGVPPPDVVAETASRTTYENLVEVKKIVGADRFLLVTAGFHLRRSVAVARRLGMKPVAAPAAIWAAQRFPAGLSWRAWSGTVLELAGRPSPKRLVYVQWASHEHLGYVWYWMLGRL